MEFRVWSFRVQGLEFRACSFMVWSLGFGVLGFDDIQAFYRGCMWFRHVPPVMENPMEKNMDMTWKLGLYSGS